MPDTLHTPYDSIEDVDDAVAVIGMAGRFPGADNIDMFWRNLCHGVESLTTLNDDELTAAGVAPALLNDPRYVKVAPLINDIELFDADFFHYSRREAELMDPQHRLFLEYAWTAMENAGYYGALYPGRIGVYAGTGLNSYLIFNLLSNRQLFQEDDVMAMIIANDKDFLATRVSYKLNLKGPSISVQSACSTSLVAIHLACESLLNGECDMALAGGVSIRVPQNSGYMCHPGGIVAHDGHCRAFDAAADGTIFGSGVGVVVLKRLNDAIDGGDTILAVVRGSAMNNDGSSKVGFTAPSIDGQARVIKAAQTVAGINPATITYVETHGTGTALGDPIEVAALSTVFREHTKKRHYCSIGAVKTNIGHLDAAAGVTGFIKTVLALQHKQLPPTLHYQQPNPNIDFENSPFYVNTELCDWVTEEHPRRAAVSAFGIGGTNAHVILEEAPTLAPSDPASPWHMLPLSAHTSTALDTQTTNLAAYFEQQPHMNLADVAYTLHNGRMTHSYRRIAICRDSVDAIDVLRGQHIPRLLQAYVKPDQAIDPVVVFMFPGQGAQYVNMGLGLYQNEPTFRHYVDYCCDQLQRNCNLNMQAILYPDNTDPIYAERHIQDTSLAQPLLFITEYALAQLWISWGVRPHMMIGHSIGEYVAACLSGVISLNDALRLVVERGRLMQQMPQGVMVSVHLTASELLSLLPEDIALAAINAPQHCVVSGPTTAIEKLERQLAAMHVEHRRLHTSHAFHSPMMEPIVDTFSDFVSRIDLNPPQMPYMSNLTGMVMTAADALDPAYWAQHLRQPVLFSEALNDIMREPNCLLLEVGPGQTLTTLARQQPTEFPDRLVVNSLRRPTDAQDDMVALLTALGSLWLHGYPIDWPAVQRHQRRRRLPLPTYPFEGKNCWIEPNGGYNQSWNAAMNNGDSQLFTWSWQTVQPTKPTSIPDKIMATSWLVYVDEKGLGNKLIDSLRARGHDVVTVRPADQFDQINEHMFTIDLCSEQNHIGLIEEMRRRSERVFGIIHLCSAFIAGADNTTYQVDDSVRVLLQALTKQPQRCASHLTVVTAGLHNVSGFEICHTGGTAAIGACVVTPTLVPGMLCRNIDVPINVVNTTDLEKLSVMLLNDVCWPNDRVVTAYRGHRRWAPSLTTVAQDTASASIDDLHFLVAANLNGPESMLVHELAKRVASPLMLVNRSLHPFVDTAQQYITALQQAGAQIIESAEGIHPTTEIVDVATRCGPVDCVLGIIDIAADMTSDRGLQQLSDFLHALEKATQACHPSLSVVCIPIPSQLKDVSVSAIATAYVSAFVATRNSQMHTGWIALQLAVDGNEHGFTVADDLLAAAIGHAIATASEGQLLASSSDPRSTPDGWSQLGYRSALSIGSPTSLTSNQAHVGVKTPYVAPSTQTQQIIADIWYQVLGIQPIGIHDNFFDLGGHSLLATQVINRLDAAFDTDLPHRLLLNATTIAELADIVESTLPLDTLSEEDIVQMVMNMSPEEAEQELRLRLDHLRG